MFCSCNTDCCIWAWWIGSEEVKLVGGLRILHCCDVPWMTTGTWLTLRISVPRFWLALLCLCSLFPVLFCFCCMLCNCCHRVVMKWLTRICWFLSFFTNGFFLWWNPVYSVYCKYANRTVLCITTLVLCFEKPHRQDKNIVSWMQICSLKLLDFCRDS
jgi:hypothetical protein